jgi:hypothetical protein
MFGRSTPLANIKFLIETRDIEFDFFVRDYWRASAENNLSGSGYFARFRGFVLKALAWLLKRAAASPAVVPNTDDLNPRHRASGEVHPKEGAPCSAKLVYDREQLSGGVG